MDNEKKETITPSESGPSGAATPTPEEQKQAQLDAELKAKEEKKANLDKAIAEAEENLRKKREEARNAASQSGAPAPSQEEKVEIDMNDPGAKAWDEHIKKTVSPLQQEIEKEKAEVRTLALREFLSDKPALASNPEKVKELVDLYDRIKIATERNKEGVLLDLNKAFAALYSEQLIDAAKTQKIDRVKELNLFNEPAIDKGATAYGSEKERMPNLSAADIKVLASWGMTPQQWWEMQNKK